MYNVILQARYENDIDCSCLRKLPAHLSLKKFMNFFVISLRNSSSRVKRSRTIKAAIYLNGMKRRIIAPPSSNRATSFVT
ncbi:hypothetical protein IEQ34_001853 [Dendrobium chrysotoxum]|uniref:Uncharacterized protein n=1 Tax=Dendrobium chrysotoxum TaxID=161865 RepID=A0AAV7HJ85_DENCH|nr:hypothetical protein IEQ34_001853 [Dendrobium chrysotoxum]